MDTSLALKRLIVELVPVVTNPYYVFMMACIYYACLVWRMCSHKYTLANNLRGLALYSHFWYDMGRIARLHFRCCWWQFLYPWNCNKITALCEYIYRDLRDYLFNLSEEKKLNAYRLSYDFNHRKCPICLQKFEIEIAESLLVCGHRYHKHCLDKWEFFATQMRVYNIRCAMCDKAYSKLTKWDYIFDPNALF